MSDCIPRLKQLERLRAKDALDKEEFSREVLDVLADHVGDPLDSIQAAYVVALLERVRSYDESDTSACDEIISYYIARTDGASVATLSDPAGMAVDDKVALVTSMKRLTYWYTILVGAGIPLNFVPLAGMLGSVMVLGGMATGMALLYTYWHHLQDGPVRTSPLKGVGLLLIPVFNLYWFFVVVHGLNRELAGRHRALDISDEPPNAILSLLFCLMVAIPTLCLIPAVSILLANPVETLASGMESSLTTPLVLALGLLFVALLTALASYVISIFMYRDMTRSMVPILLRKQNATRPHYASLAILAVSAAAAYGLLAFIIGLLTLGEILGPLYGRLGLGWF